MFTGNWQCEKQCIKLAIEFCLKVSLARKNRFFFFFSQSDVFGVSNLLECVSWWAGGGENDAGRDISLGVGISSDPTILFFFPSFKNDFFFVYQKPRTPLCLGAHGETKWKNTAFPQGVKVLRVIPTSWFARCVPQEIVTWYTVSRFLNIQWY